MNARVLLVDDDPNLLKACERALAKRFDLDTALGGQEALERIARSGDYAVVVSDMRMPGMDGIQLLARVQVATPESVRMMLTGNADLETAIAAVNDGQVFRFIRKPCQAEHLASFIEAGVNQHRLVRAERELLEETLNGAVRVCTEILAAADPRTHGHALKVRDLVRPIAKRIGIQDVWQLEVAALLAKIGNATIPPAVMVRVRHPQDLTEVERRMLSRVPAIGHDLLANIPRLGPVAKIVLYSERHFDGSNDWSDDLVGTAIPIGARLLRIVSDFVDLEESGETKLRAMQTLRQRTGWYDPELLAAAAEILCPPPTVGNAIRESLAVCVADVRLGDLLVSNVEAHDDLLVLKAGTVLTPTMLTRLRNFASVSTLREPLLVQRAHARQATPV